MMMNRRIQRNFNEKNHKDRSIKEIRKENKQPRYYELKNRKKEKPLFYDLFRGHTIVKPKINEGRLILKGLGYKAKKTKDHVKLKKLQQTLRAKVLQLSYNELLKVKTKDNKHTWILVTNAEKTQAGILRSNIIKLAKLTINPIYKTKMIVLGEKDTSVATYTLCINKKQLKIKLRNEQRKSRRNKKNQKSL